jgi:hypothetical protein
MKITKYLWCIPALYVSYMFGDKIVEGLAHSEEFMDIISLVPGLQSFAYQLTPLVGVLDLIIGVSLLLNPFVTKNDTVQKVLFVWAIIWPFVPSSLRYFGGVAEFEIVEVLSISIAALVSFVLWSKFTKGK